MFVVLRPGSYDEDSERIEFGEIHLFVGPQFVITLRRGTRPDLTATRVALEAEPDFLSTGPEAMLTALLDGVVTGTPRSFPASKRTSTRSRTASSPTAT